VTTFDTQLAAQPTNPPVNHSWDLSEAAAMWFVQENVSWWLVNRSLNGQTSQLWAAF